MGTGSGLGSEVVQARQGGGAWWEAEPGRGGVGQGAGLAARRGGATSPPLGAGGPARAASE